MIRLPQLKGFNKGLVIEVDGGYHELTKEQDDVRTWVLNNEGFDVMRFTNDEVLNHTQKVIRSIKERLDKQPERTMASPQPSPKEGELKDEAQVLSFGEDLGEASKRL